ncbi:MAG: co-chaperone GroES [Patescibacteria group bacterium]
MMFQPLGDRVLVQPVQKEETTKSGIIIPASAQEERAEGEIIALGSGIKEGKKYEFSVKKGDKVLFGKYSGEELKIEGVEYKVMREEEILGIL